MQCVPWIIGRKTGSTDMPCSISSTAATATSRRTIDELITAVQIPRGGRLPPTGELWLRMCAECGGTYAAVECPRPLLSKKF